MAGAAAVLPWKMAVREAYAQYGVNSPALQKFLDPMRLVGFDIPIAGADATPAPVTGVTHYTIDVGQFTDMLHSQMPNPTRLWGYSQGGNAKHLGGVFVATKDVPIQITFNNNLPAANIIPVDITIPGANQAMDRTAVHLHGGFVPWISDGGPFDWWAPDGTHGGSFLNNSVLNPGAAANQAEYYYPNAQTDRFMWYHDHAFGITRTNAYAGIASGYVLVDPVDDAALVAQGIPSAGDLYSPAGAPNGGTIYMVFQDKIFVPTTGIPAGYPITNALPGDLFYPYIYDLALFGALGLPSFGGPLSSPLPVPSVVPEMFGDTALVNGAAYPFLEVKPRLYRIRMLNACNSRFLNPRLVATAGATFPASAEPDPKVAGPSFLQIGTEGGFLPAAVPVNGKKQLPLLIAPAERTDLLVDFTGIAPGTEFILYNDAGGPFPGGARIFDYFPQNPKTPVSTPGFGPNTRTLMKFRVVAAAAGDPLPAMPATVALPANEPPLVVQTPGVPTPIPATVLVNGQTFAVNVKQLTLNEGFDEFGRLGQFLGTGVATAPGFFGRKYEDATTENPTAGSVEVWQIANLTADTHPIHFHLVNVQILSRQAFSVRQYNGFPNFQGAPVAPDLNELGYKETVRMNPGEVTTVIMKFDLPVVPFTVPPSPRTGGNEYVWHCHILEHEEHDMMRPLVVT